MMIPNDKTKKMTFLKNQLSIDLLIIIAIVAIFTIFYFLNSNHLWNLVTKQQDIIFGSDTKDTLFHLNHPSFEDDARKHLLLFVTLGPITKFMQFVLHVSSTRSIRLLLSMIAAINIGGIYYFLKKYSGSTINALSFAGVYAMTFSTMVIYSIPETYSSSNLFILIYLAILFSVRKKITYRNTILLSLIAAFASLYNPVLLSLIVIHLLMLFLQNGKIFWVKAAVSNIFLAFSIYFLSNFVIYGMDFITFVDGYSSRYASLTNFLNHEKVLSVLSDFYYFSILSPHSCLTARLGLSDWHSYIHFPLKLCFIILLTIFMIYTIYTIFKKNNENRTFLVAILVWMVILTMFYIYFNPNEAMLYSSQVLFPMVILFSQSFERIKIKSMYKYLLLGILFSFMAYTNILTYYNGMG